MNLEELDSMEKHIISEVRKTVGLMEEKFEQLRQRGIYAEYGKVFKAYAQLVESENAANEALKRAIFLTWYQSAEPSCFTGIDNLPNDICQKVLKALDLKIETKSLDAEFHWMLSHYILVIDYIFDSFPNIKSIQTVSLNKTLNESTLDASQFKNRGQMGDYWSNIIDNHCQKIEMFSNE